MTTIAYRNRILAADTSMISSYNIMPRAMTKITADHGCLAGAAGSASYAAAFLRWFRTGEAGDPPKAVRDDNSHDMGMIVRPDGSVTVYDSGGWYEFRTEYFAMGSGRDQAFGAMFAGANAEGAVRAAIAHDPGTAGDVDVLRLDG